VWNSKLFADHGCLSTFASSGRPHDEQAHYFRKPS
jgi:hypothetical protein